MLKWYLSLILKDYRVKEIINLRFSNIIILIIQISFIIRGRCIFNKINNNIIRRKIIIIKGIIISLVEEREAIKSSRIEVAEEGLIGEELMSVIKVIAGPEITISL